MDREKIESIIESLLFAAGEAITLRRLCDVISEADKKEVRAAMEELARKWDHPGRGLRLVEVSGGYQFQTAPENSAWVGRLLQTRPVRLSRASLETLAIVAYKQPVTRTELEEIRGVDSGGVLKTLLEHGFIRIAGRKDVAGRPLIYATDKKFMEFFRMKSLAELPTLKELDDMHGEATAETGPASDGDAIEEVPVHGEEEAGAPNEPEELEETDADSREEEMETDAPGLDEEGPDDGEGP